MVTHNKNKYEQILNTFKEACYDLGKRVFDVEKPVEVVLKKEDEKDKVKYLLMKIVPVAYYKDGKIHFPTTFLDIIIKVFEIYKTKPEIIEEVLGILAHECTHHLLDLEKISEDDLRHVDEGIAEAIKTLYSKFIREGINKNKRSLDGILKYSNKRFSDILKNQSEISRIEKEIEYESLENLKELRRVIQDSLNYCYDESDRNLEKFDYLLELVELLDKTLELVYNTLYRTAGYIVLKRKGIKNLVEDVSKISKREEIDKIIREYENILFEDFEKLDSEGYRIFDTVNCLKRRKLEILDKMLNLDNFIDRIISFADRKIKEQDERIEKFEKERKNLKS